MQSRGYTANLRDDPEAIESYKAYHADTWPEVLEHSRRIGVGKARIFLLGRRLFMYMETTDNFQIPDASRPPEDAHPRVQEWQLLMAGYLERVPEAGPESVWAEMELIHTAGDDEDEGSSG